MFLTYNLNGIGICTEKAAGKSKLNKVHNYYVLYRWSCVFYHFIECVVKYK